MENQKYLLMMLLSCPIMVVSSESSLSVTPVKGTSTAETIKSIVDALPVVCLNPSKELDARTVAYVRERVQQWMISNNRDHIDKGVIKVGFSQEGLMGVGIHGCEKGFNIFLGSA